MHIVYLQDHDGHKKGKDYMVEPTLGRRLCNNGISIPYVTHMKNLKVEKEAEAEAKAKAEAEKKAKKEAKIKKLLEERDKSKTETAISKKAKTRNKAIKY